MKQSASQFVLYTNVISPHQLPLARELVKRLGTENFRYVYTEKVDRDHANLRFEVKNLGEGEERIVPLLYIDEDDAESWLESADVLLSGLRDFALFERRAKKGLKNLYMSERWFKPPVGMLRLLHPQYLGYARRAVKMARDGKLMLLPIGVHARRDFARIGVPDSAMETWGYFVEPSRLSREEVEKCRGVSEALRVMWCGRRIPLKHVEDIERAVKHLRQKDMPISLDLYSNLTLEGVREEMRRHDVFVFASNGYDGWGAVVSEALEERMAVLGTFEAGSTATMLPKEQLYHCGDWRALVKILERCHDADERAKMYHEIGEWSAAKAAERLMRRLEG